MGHQALKDHQEGKDILESKDQLAQPVKEDSLVHQVYLVKENQVQMACQESQACQEGKVIRDHQVCQESQDSLDLVNQDTPEQRVIKVWVDHLDLLDQKEIRAMVDCLVCLDPLDQMVHRVLQGLWEPQEVWVHLVLKETVEKEDLKGLMEFRVILVLLGCLVKTVCLERVETQDQEVHQDQLVPKETVGIKVCLVHLVLQDLLGQKDKMDYLVKLDLKVLKEYLEWMVQQDHLGLLVLWGQKEIAVHLVHQALQVRGIQVLLVPWDPQGKLAHQDHLGNQVSQALLDHQVNQEKVVCLPTWLECSL
ncbi:hypothetical protein D5F01_LYC01490 [Larimichthys crocea]|uniref:Uncharacterized protein n=1 Tax=Larimichthys crocea TaxID=215358 RepID=A0A6G0J6D4_LARCR|nr:hypothetical protein D5F01_LYC01490 [Larimichthys crocea]